ncbi:LETM1-domain-containing protein [Gonapodya prolifera JEL478]|uniref:LETM1-domain-containing protein n=1 Tax=Gonapodya prolifera (strain JEL478) TaxID=1344416 RepID=A0A139AQX1_GONPJ|nr:LETM1-domain-containing protein [Gonapodya prolifera JEL478]|eukprot:KXS18913.1 LETM1-domain-containing protein [Gonapodya prolifera JEL478]
MYHSAARAHRHAIPRSLSLSSRGSSHPRPSLLPINPFPVFPLPPATFSTDASTSSHAPNHAPPPPPPIPLKSGQSSHPSVPSSFSAQTQPSRQGGQQGQGTQHPSSVLSEVSPTPTIPSLATSAQPSKPIELRRTKPDLAVQLVKDAAKKSSREQQASIGATAAASTTTTALADAVAASSATATPAVAPVAEKKSLWVRVKEEAVHYWHGTKLLGAEIKISSRLLLKLLRGGGLTRREHKQLLRTVADLVRLVPFIVLLIIPFAELALPFLLRFFPNMLPSTFESKFAEEEKRMKLVKVRLEMAKFLQDTITEVWVTEGTNQGTAVKEFNEFFKKYRGSEQLAPTEEIVRIARKFDESLTLDNLTHNQLISLSRFMSLNAFGSDNFLRYQIRMKLRDIKRDDQMIATEGISALNLDEVRAAASQRGIRTVGISPARLRQELQQWLDLSLNYKIPGTLLLLSRALAYDKPIPVSVNTPEALQAALQSLPEAALVEAETQIAEAAGEKVDYKRRLELIRKQEELIQLELEQVQREKAEHAAAKAREQEAQAAEKAKLLAQAQAGAAAAVKMWEGVPQAEAAAQEQTTAPVPVEIRPVQIPEQQLRALGEALQAMGSPSALDPEREELETLKHERREYEEDIGEIQTMTGGKSAESSTSRYLGKRLERLISKIDQELKHYDKDIGDKLNLLKPDEYGQVTVAQLEEALKVINAHKDNPEIAQIVEFLDQNHDGLVVLKEVIDFARKAEQVGQEKEGESGTYSGQSGLTGDIISAARTILHEEQAQRNTKNGAAQTETESPLPSGTASNSSKDGRTEH